MLGRLVQGVLQGVWAQDKQKENGKDLEKEKVSFCSIFLLPGIGSDDAPDE